MNELPLLPFQSHPAASPDHTQLSEGQAMPPGLGGRRRPRTQMFASTMWMCYSLQRLGAWSPVASPALCKAVPRVTPS